jgi:hypothetical protein
MILPGMPRTYATTMRITPCTLAVLLSLCFGCASAEPPRAELSPEKAARARALKAELAELYTGMMGLNKAVYYEGSYLKAEQGFRKARTWFEAELGAEHPSSLDARRYLFHALAKQGKDAEAEEVRRAPPPLAEVGIPDTVHEALTREQEDQAELALARTALKRVQEKSGPEAPETLDQRATLVVHLVRVERYEEAERELRTLHEAEVRVRGAASPKAVWMLKRLVSLQRRLRLNDLAARSAGELVQVYESDPSTFRAELPGAYLTLSWQQVLVRNFDAALEATRRGREWDGAYFALDANRAHALLFLGKVDEARELYLSHRGEQVLGRHWEEVMLEDLDLLEAAGIEHPEFPALRKLLRAPR